MAETLPLDPVARGTLLPPEDRLARLQAVQPALLALLEGEDDPIAAQATIATVLWQALPQCNWVGFYRRIGPTTLAVGPYQGGIGCLRIDFARGVCGAAARTQQVQLHADVRLAPDHIACDADTLSELVIPMLDQQGTLQAVLDLDSTHLGGLSQQEADWLQAQLPVWLGGGGLEVGLAAACALASHRVAATWWRLYT
jgi:L-methionine (R)-S-oxide reductase